MSSNILDAAWKEIFDFYFQSFLEFCYPEIAQAIDWSRGYENLDKELLAINKESVVGTRLVDKLIKVWRLDNKEWWLLCHLEIQGQAQSEFSKRMYIYQYRLFDKYDIPIISMAILTDNNTSWRPHSYCYDHWGCSLQFKFIMIKLMDYSNQNKELMQSTNPFAMVILAQLAMLKSKKNLQNRFIAKLRLSRMLYSKGWDKTNIINLYRFIDSIMVLPETLEIEYKQEIAHFEKEKQMAYLCPSEQLSMREGMQQGMRLGKLEGERTALLRVMQKKFGAIPMTIRQLIEEANADTLLEWLDTAIFANSLDEIFAIAS